MTLKCFKCNSQTFTYLKQNLNPKLLHNKKQVEMAISGILYFFILMGGLNLKWRRNTISPFLIEHYDNSVKSEKIQ